MKELPATMLLSPIGFDTLAVEIWKATENVDFADAAAASLMILLFCFYNRNDRKYHSKDNKGERKSTLLFTSPTIKIC